MLHATMDAVII